MPPHAGTDRSEPKAICLTFWLHGHNNPSYEALFSRLGSVVFFRKVTFSRWRAIQALQYRLWARSSYRLIYPLAFRYLSRRYSTLFTVDPWQIPLWNRKVILDMNDPTYDPAVLTLLKQPQVEAIVVSTERVKRTLVDLGVVAPVHVIPQIVPVHLDADEIREVRSRYRSDGEVVAGYPAPTLSLSRDGPRRWRRGVDDLDLLFAAAEEARKVEPRLRLWLLGEPSPSVRQFARARSWVRLFGYVPRARLFAYIANFDIGLYPRTTILPAGSFSVKIVQYMACGLPVVSTLVEESLPVQEAGCGIICHSKSEFAKALIELAQSSELRTRLGLKGKAPVKIHTDWSHLPVYEALIRDVVHQSA
ncbi:MAG: glycosyltransferase [Candidatus Methylomirabilaceae bacterium]